MKRKGVFWILDVLANNIASRDEVLALIMGDWNFVTEDVDRFSSSSSAHTGHSDKNVSDHFDKAFVSADLVSELEQPAYTHQNSLGCSRIDRVYSTHSLADLISSTVTFP